MKSIILLCLSFFVTQLLLAQDIIYTKPRKAQIEAKVTEVDNGYIHYRRFDNPDGPLYKYPKKDVDSIVYANGTADYFDGSRTIPAPPHPRFRSARVEKERRPLNKADNNNLMIAAGALDFANLDNQDVQQNMKNRASIYLQLAYERHILRQKLGVEAGSFIGVNDGAYGFSGALRLYPKKRGRVNFGFGPQYIFAVKKLTTRYELLGNYTDFKVHGKAQLHTMALSTKMKYDLNDALLLSLNMAIGGTVGGSEAGSSNYPNNWSMRPNNLYYNCGIGIAYRFK